MFVEYVKQRVIRAWSLRMEQGRLVLGRSAGFGRGKDG